MHFMRACVECRVRSEYTTHELSVGVLFVFTSQRNEREIDAMRFGFPLVRSFPLCSCCLGAFTHLYALCLTLVIDAARRTHIVVVSMVFFFCVDTVGIEDLLLFHLFMKVRVLFSKRYNVIIVCHRIMSLESRGVVKDLCVLCTEH